MRLPTSGFTLVEILITIAIIGILAAVGFVSFMPFIERSRLDNAVAEAGSSVRYAVSEARRNNRTITLRIDGTTMTVSRDTTTLRSVTLQLTPALTCRSTSTCPTTYTFSAPFGTSQMDFALAFRAGTRTRELFVRGPLATVSAQ